MNKFHLIISTPDGDVLDDNVEALILRGALGDLAVLAGHMPMITTVKPGICRILYEEEKEKSAAIDGGLLSVDTEKVSLLCSVFEIQEQTPPLSEP